jgi:hypothetical protein
VQAFYNNVLGVSDEDISTIEWKEVSSRIIRTYEQTRTQAATHGQNIAFKRLDAIAIANRILRKDNYLIALFNKDILDLSVPFLGRRDWLTQIVEWSLSYCILSYVFDDRGQVKRRFLKESNRGRLVLGLQRRFLFMGTLSLVLAPLLFVFLILHFFFKYAQTYHKDPASLGARQYSPLARWKFREFNELEHIFNLRLNRSYAKAVSYLNQFPQEHIIISAK